MSSRRTWDVFCSVVDNYGDIGVTWRLARQLVREFACNVTLWVDNLHAFHRLCRAVDPAAAGQCVDGVSILRWDSNGPARAPADIVVETFSARLPDAYVRAMAVRATKPVWILLEYLSAEPWVDGCHALPSPHPTLPLTKHFFFPGFTAATGGLLIERDYKAERDAFQANRRAREAFFASLGVRSADRHCISLFFYENAALAALVKAWSSANRGILCIVPEGAALAQVERALGAAIRPGTPVSSGSLEVAAVQFLELDAYDRLLWACDMNFVRGEDSFVRAQLAARPMAWQAYPQEAHAHVPKVTAFLNRYAPAGSPQCPERTLIEAWNGNGDIAHAWQQLCDDASAVQRRAEGWADTLLAGPNLARSLVRLTEDRLK